MPNKKKDPYKEWLRSWEPGLRRVRSPKAALKVLDRIALPFPECGGLSPAEIERLKQHFRQKLAEEEASGKK